MKATIERSGCISCGLCAATCPEVFEMADDGFAEVVLDEVPEELEKPVIEARDGCPSSVISVD